MVVKELFARLGLEVDPEGFERAESLFHSLTHGWKGVALGAAAVVGALVEVGRETAEAGEEASHAAQRTGLTTDAYQELAHAATMTGIETGTLEMALFKMSRAAEQAKNGSTAAGDAFKGLLTLNDLKTLKPDEMLEKLADGFMHIKDQGKRADKAMEIFGRGGGAQLIPLLNKGSEGIAEFRRQAHELGVVQTQENIKADEAFIESQRELTESFKGMRNQLGNWVIPKLLQFGKWLKNVRRELGEWKKAHAEGILIAIKLAIIGLASAIIALGIVNAATAASMIGWWVAMRIGAVVNAIQVAAAWAIANAPLLLMIATIGIVLLWLEDLYQFLTGGDSVIGDFVASIKDAMLGPDGFKGLVMDVVRWFLSFFPDSVGEAASKAVGWLIDKFTLGFQKVKQFFGSLPGGFAFGDFSGGAGAGSTGFSGGAASPSASVAASPSAAGGAIVNNVNAPNQITINTHPGMSGDEIVGAMDRKIAEHHEKVTRETHAAAP